MMIAAYAATGLLAAGVHAALMLRDRSNLFHRQALAIGLAVGGVASVIQPMSGHYAAQMAAKTQPVKLAAMEGQFRTESRAPLRLGGLPDTEAWMTRYALEIPAALSILAFNTLMPRQRAWMPLLGRTGLPCWWFMSRSR